jgi:hypothetical protein
VLVCEGPIIGIRRIWRNGKLVYDQTPLPTSADEPDPDTLIEKLQAAIKSKASSSKFASQLTIYLGDETQLPDPTLEAMFGVGEVGANRGIAYVVIEDDDVTDTAGAVPQYEFEVARAGAVGEDDYVAGLGPEFYYKLQGDGVDFTGNHSTLVPGGTYAWGELGFSMPSITAYASATQGSGLESEPNITVLARCRVDSASGGSVIKDLVSHVTNSVLGYYSWSLHLRGANKMTPVVGINGNGGSPDTVTAGFEVGVDEEFLMGFRLTGGTTLDLIYNGQVVATGAASGSFSGTGAFTVGGGAFFPSSYGVNGTISHVVGYRRALTDAEISRLSTYFMLDGRTYYQMPDGTEYYVTATGEVVVIAGGVGETISQDTPTLAEIITTICRRVGLEAADIDVTDVASVDVTGYVIARATTADAALKPLLDAFQIGMYEADGKIRFVQLGAATVDTLTSDDLVAQDGPPVTETRAQEVELPRKINVLYSDPATAYTTTKQTSERIASTVEAVGEVNIELPVVMTADQAA